MLDTGSGSNALFTGEHFVLDKNRSSIGTYRCIAHNGNWMELELDVNCTLSIDMYTCLDIFRVFN